MHAHVLRRPQLRMREITRSSSFAKIRVTRKLDDERAIRCSFSTFSNIKKTSVNSVRVRSSSPWCDLQPGESWTLTTLSSVRRHRSARTVVHRRRPARTVVHRRRSARSLVLWLTDAASTYRGPPTPLRAYWGSSSFRPDVSGEETIPLTTPSQQSVVSSGLIGVLGTRIRLIGLHVTDVRRTFKAGKMYKAGHQCQTY